MADVTYVDIGAILLRLTDDRLAINKKPKKVGRRTTASYRNLLRQTYTGVKHTDLYNYL